MDDTWESGVRLMVVLYREFEQAARCGDLSMAQYRTLLLLLGGNRRAGELAIANSVTRPTASVMIRRLRERGWIREITDPDDARITRLELTTSGRERLRLFESTLATRLDEIFPRLSAETFRTFQELYHAHLTHYRMGSSTCVGGSSEFPA